MLIVRRGANSDNAAFELAGPQDSWSNRVAEFLEAKFVVIGGGGFGLEANSILC
jgi:hypothetical protein